MKHNIKKELYNLKFLAKKVVQASPGYVLAAFVESMLEAALPFVAILFPKYRNVFPFWPGMWRRPRYQRCF